jgi:hypothetical protein
MMKIIIPAERKPLPVADFNHIYAEILAQSGFQVIDFGQQRIYPKPFIA